MLGIKNETSIFEYRLKQVAYGLLQISAEKLPDMTPNEILDLWSAHIYAENHSQEAERTNRLILAIVGAGMGDEEQKKRLLKELLYEDPAIKANKIIDEIEAIKQIKEPKKGRIDG